MVASYVPKYVVAGSKQRDKDYENANYQHIDFHCRALYKISELCARAKAFIYTDRKLYSTGEILKVLFIYPDICRYGGGLHYGIAWISAVLKMNGHKTSLLHITRDISKKKLLTEVRRVKPDIICFSSTTNQFPYVKLYANWIKGVFNLPIICGGIHVTLCPDDAILCNGIDIVCIGEGEYPLLELVNALESGKENSQIMNLWIRKKGIIIRNPLRPLIQNLDELPFPDTEIFQYERILKRRGGEAGFLAGRGCPYSCTYCCNHAVRKLYNGKGSYVRIRSVSNVLEEIKYVAEKYGSLVKKINFDDDTFTLFHKWVKEFCKAYKKEFDYPFSCNVRADTVNMEILVALKRAGCDTIKIGIESGDEWLRRNILKRSMTNRQIITACKTAHEVGIKVYTFNMIGLPFETPSMIEKTIELNRLIAPNRVQTSIFYPYPNTELYRICQTGGFLIDKHKKSYFDEGTTLNLPTLTEKQIKDYYTKLKELDVESYIKTYYPKLMLIYKMLKFILRSRTAPLLYWFKKSIFLHVAS